MAIRITLLVSLAFCSLAEPMNCRSKFTNKFSIVSNVKWPAYTVRGAENIVFDANVTDLAYREPDTYRAEGIAYLSSTVLLD